MTNTNALPTLIGSRFSNRLKLFLALSRTPHGLLDMATPCFAALLWLGEFPPLPIILLGLLTTFAGYTAVYAFNDVVDYNLDRQKLGGESYCAPESYLDAVMIRHPMAQGCLSFKEGLAWAVGWSLAALIGAYLLNPFCVVIFLAGCLLEALYCLMWKVSPLRAVISGIVKTTGPLAGVFAVDPNPSPVFLMVLFLSLFFWEIGGQNIPADWTDMEADKSLGAQTIPVYFGPEKTGALLVICIAFSLLLTGVLFQLSKFGPAPIAGIVAAGLGAILMLGPALGLYKKRQRAHAMALFNRASYFPAALLAITVLKVLFLI